MFRCLGLYCGSLATVLLLSSGLRAQNATSATDDMIDTTLEALQLFSRA